MSQRESQEDIGDKASKNWWQKISRGPKWVIVTAVPILLATAIPGLAPWVVDRAQDLVGGAPLTATASDDPGLEEGQYLATDSALTVPASSNVYQTMLNQGAVQLGRSGQLITLTDNRSGEIYVNRITATIEARRPPLSGTALVIPPQGMGETITVDFALGVGADRVAAMVPADSGSPYQGTRPYLADGKFLYLQQGQSQPIAINASAKSCYCEWRVLIDYVYRGKSGELVVPPIGQKPFATTSWASGYQTEYIFDENLQEPWHRYVCATDLGKCQTGF
ncbi:MAG TPA: hypothetical protein VJ914_11995 [Pseudonocardiaceae bacterium]|nr:hypothetical protein [Pseudonocardiaceae bacterium]